MAMRLWGLDIGGMTIYVEDPDSEFIQELRVFADRPVKQPPLAREFVTVPREPTQAMLEAGRLGDPLGCDVSDADLATFYRNIWVQMVGASGDGDDAQAETLREHG